MKEIPRVGLTGGIGSGKSMVAAHFATWGIPHIDADQITRSLCMPGEPVLAEIIAVFGPGVLTANGQLDRIGMRKRIFTDATARRRLEAIIHPRVLEAMAHQLTTLDAPYAILVIPLLLESCQRTVVDRILVVDCPEEIQIQRVMVRDSVSRAQVEAVLSAQITREARLAAADDVLVNTVNLDSLHRQIDNLHQYYLQWVGNYKRPEGCG